MQYQKDFTNVDKLIKAGMRFAIIDVDNTITKSTIVDFYLFIKKREYSPSIFYLFLLFFAICAPYFIILDFISRDLFVKFFVLRKFRTMDYKHIENEAEEYFQQVLTKKFISFTHDLIFHLKEKKIDIIILSNNLDLLVKQYGKYFDVNYKALTVIKTTKGITLNLDEVANFKEKEIENLPSKFSLGVGDSKYDLPVLNHVEFSMIVSKKPKKWFSLVNKQSLFVRNDLKLDEVI